MRGFVAPLAILAALCPAGTTAHAATAQAPAPVSPTSAIALFEWCWDQRDLARYRDLFTGDFRFEFAPGDSAGDPYPDGAWTRDDELASATQLFTGGGAPEPAVTAIALAFDETSPPGTLLPPGKTYPWHQQILVSSHRLEVMRVDGTTMRAWGRSLFCLVRGDSAVLPQELIDRGFTPDSSRWYIERWVDMPDPGMVPDRPPLVTAPASITHRVGGAISFNVTAIDPDRQPISSLTVIGVPPETFTALPTNVSGTLTWIPTDADTGTYRVTFTATNALSGSATTLINVLPFNHPPLILCVVRPTSGPAPLVVEFDASGSTDPDGNLRSYEFEFGDGTTVHQTSPVATHTYRSAGRFNATVFAIDMGSAIAETTLTISASGPNSPPVAALAAAPASGTEPLQVQFDASASRDPDGTIVSYQFDFGDGTVATQGGPVVDHTYSRGDRTVSVTATDNLGASASASASIRVIGVPQGTSSDAVALLEQCWDNRDPGRYRELFTEDFRFGFASEDSAGDPYPDRAWTREDELASATRLFTGGSGTEPAVTGIVLALNGTSLPGTLLIPGKPYPWHQQILVPSYTLDVARADGSTLRSAGPSLFYLVRGDSAVLPQELIERGFSADSSRWFIERWDDMPDPRRVPDTPPVVTAPGAIAGRVGTPIVVNVTAYDPNQHEITSLIATGAAAPFFSVRSFNTAGTVAWVPEMGDVGTHSMTFTATNALMGSAVTLITVLPPIQHPVASLAVSPSSGSEPLVVTLDASGSSDSNGFLVSYRFDFGDGSNVIQAHPVASHSYRAGSWIASVTVTDDEGGTNSISQRIAVAASSVQPNLVGNPSFEVDTRGWRDYAGSVVARIPGGFDGAYALQATGPEVMAGSFGVNDSPDWIKPTTAAGRRYRFATWVRSTSSHGTAKLRVTEYLLATKARLGQVTSVGKQLSPDWQLIQVDYTTISAGSSLDVHVRDFPVVPGEVFVTDNLSIRDITGVAGIVPAEGEFETFAEEVPPLQPALYPSPVQSVAVLSFATSQTGALRVEILDLAGRRVRRLADEAEASPGMHVLPVHGTSDDGRRLSPGVYFYRIEAPEGARTGRFVVLR